MRLPKSGTECTNGVFINDFFFSVPRTRFEEGSADDDYYVTMKIWRNDDNINCLTQIYTYTKETTKKKFKSIRTRTLYLFYTFEMSAAEFWLFEINVAVYP